MSPAIFIDPNVRLSAKGLYCYIMELPYWTFGIKDLSPLSENEDSLIQALDDLVVNGYLEINSKGGYRKIYEQGA